jgi:ribosomal protein S18 acetylase RimI-like enzyme
MADMELVEERKAEVRSFEDQLSTVLPSQKSLISGKLNRAAMTSPQQIEILDLRHFNARQLRPLLDQEAEFWRQRLRWDYRSSTDLLLQYLDSRILPGFVALDRGRVCGYTFCVYEGHKAVIGDLYAATDTQSPIAIAHTLAQHLLETLNASPGINRIEAQLLLFDSGTLAPVFSNLNPHRPAFTAFPRLFLESTLPANPAHVEAPSGFEFLPWSSNFYQHSAELIHRAYQGHIDSSINDQYRSLAGSLRFLHNIIRFPGCGVFDSQSSWVLRDRANHALAAVILCSRVAPDVAHVTQLCVAPAYRHRRLGANVLGFCMARMPHHGYTAITLTVSEANHAAVRLYTAAGFTTRHRFDALVLDKKPHRLRLV